MFGRKKKVEPKVEEPSNLVYETIKDKFWKDVIDGNFEYTLEMSTSIVQMLWDYDKKYRRGIFQPQMFYKDGTYHFLNMQIKHDASFDEIVVFKKGNQIKYPLTKKLDEIQIIEV